MCPPSDASPRPPEQPSGRLLIGAGITDSDWSSSVPGAPSLSSICVQPARAENSCPDRDRPPSREPLLSHQLPPSLRVRPLRPDEIPFVVNQHRRHFPAGFFARLGDEFLEEYYHSFVTSPHACLFMAEEASTPVGYIAGIVDPDLHRKHLLRAHRRPLIVRALKGMARNPSLLVLFLRTRAGTYARKLVIRASAPVSTAGTPTEEMLNEGFEESSAPAVLSHLVVDPSSRCRGTGRRLVEVLATTARAAGTREMVLVTEVGGLGEGFYRHLGWRHTGTRETRDSRTLLVFAAELAGRPLAGGDSEAHHAD